MQPFRLWLKWNEERKGRNDGETQILGAWGEERGHKKRREKTTESGSAGKKKNQAK